MSITRISDVEIVEHFGHITIDLMELVRVARWLASQCGQQPAGEEIADTAHRAIIAVKAVVEEAIKRSGA